MTRRGTLLVLASVLAIASAALSGCVNPFTPFCDIYYRTRAEWIEPGLYEKLPVNQTFGTRESMMVSVYRGLSYPNLTYLSVKVPEGGGPGIAAAVTPLDEVNFGFSTMARLSNARRMEIVVQAFHLVGVDTLSRDRIHFEPVRSEKECG